jgi:hypothetical protein
VVADTYNPSYWGRGEQKSGGSPFKASLGKKIGETLISTNIPGVEFHVYSPSYTGGIDRRIMVQG